MPYRYIIFSEDYTVYGLDDPEEAARTSEFEQVVDTERGEMLVFGEEARPIPEWGPPEEAGEEE